MKLKDILKETVANAAPETYTRYEGENDEVMKKEIGDRRPKLTLRMINRLKKIRSTKNLEMAKKQELLGIMYGQGEEDEGL